MRRFLVIFSALALFAGAIYAADSSSIAPRGYDSAPDRFAGTVALDGKSPRTTSVHVDNVARSLSSLVSGGGGTYLGGSDNTLTPISVLISCENVATRWAFQLAPSASVGHIIPANGNWQTSGPNALALMKGISGTASDNVSCAITLWY